MHTALGEIGESDCETIGGGAFAQPLNAWSSFAYVLVGLLVVVRGLRAPAGQRLPQTVFGLTLVWVGVGSVEFHGPQPGWARLAHDLSILAVLAFVVVFDTAAIYSWSPARLWSGFVGLVAVLGVITAVAPDIAIGAGAPLVVVAVITEVVIYRRGLRGAGVKTRTLRLYGTIASVAVVGGFANVLGRTDGPLCDPDGLLQLHAVWHFLTAIAFGLWAFIGFPKVDADRLSTSTVAQSR
ncbi:MAG: ceramidase domain-containing protein [Actinomycetota bacterium]|nr:ceramidase domain-containing protein [Actinomycetota bacterium]